MKTLIWGLGKSGLACLNLIKDEEGQIFLYDDDKNIIDSLQNLKSSNVHFVKRLTQGFLSILNRIIISPSIDFDNEWLEFARSKGVEILSELELGYENIGDNDLICITGTNGKTTTVRLVAQMLRYGKIDAREVGNIGLPLCQELKKIKDEKDNDFASHVTNNEKNTTAKLESNLSARQVANIDKKLKKKDSKKVFVCETSSFQLQGCKTLRPKIACLLNISNDHLNRHKTMQEYTKVKYSIFKNQKQGDVAILSSDLNYSGSGLPYQFGLQKVKRGCYQKNDDIYFKKGLFSHKICKVADVNLMGKHNLKNIMCAIIIAKLYKVKTKDIVRAIKDFVPSKHRLQCVYTRNGSNFFDDSKATNIDSTKNAIETFSGNKNFLLILGGSDKGCEFDTLFSNLPPNLVKIFATGEVREKLYDAYINSKCSIPFEKCENLKTCVYLACQELKDGEDLLLSPSCASFDEFKDYKQRGEMFLKYIKDYYEEFKE